MHMQDKSCVAEKDHVNMMCSVCGVVDTTHDIIP